MKHTVFEYNTEVWNTPCPPVTAVDVSSGLVYTLSEGKPKTTMQARHRKRPIGARTQVDGTVWASYTEAVYAYKLASWLRSQHDSAIISMHTRFPLIVEDSYLCHYESDIVFRHAGKLYIMDVKPARLIKKKWTPWMEEKADLKLALMKLLYPSYSVVIGHPCGSKI